MLARICLRGFVKGFFYISLNLKGMCLWVKASINIDSGGMGRGLMQVQTALDTLVFVPRPLVRRCSL